MNKPPPCTCSRIEWRPQSVPGLQSSPLCQVEPNKGVPGLINSNK